MRFTYIGSFARVVVRYLVFAPLSMDWRNKPGARDVILCSCKRIKFKKVLALALRYYKKHTNYVPRYKGGEPNIYVRNNPYI